MCACYRVRASTFSIRPASTLGYSSCLARVLSAGTVRTKFDIRLFYSPSAARILVCMQRADVGVWDCLQIFKRWRRCLLVENRRSDVRPNHRASRGTCDLRGAVNGTG